MHGIAALFGIRVVNPRTHLAMPRILVTSFPFFCAVSFSFFFFFFYLSR